MARETERTEKPAGFENRIEALLQSDQARILTPDEITSELGPGKSVAIRLTLGRMIKSGKVEKCPDGGYRMPVSPSDATGSNLTRHA